MGALAGLLQTALFFAMVGYGWFFGEQFVTSANESVSQCQAAGGRIECITGPGMWMYLLWPIFSMIVALGFMRGASVLNQRAHGRGIPFTLIGFASLALSLTYALEYWTVG